MNYKGLTKADLIEMLNVKDAEIDSLAKKVDRYLASEDSEFDNVEDIPTSDSDGAFYDSLRLASKVTELEEKIATLANHNELAQRDLHNLRIDYNKLAVNNENLLQNISTLYSSNEALLTQRDLQREINIKLTSDVEALTITLLHIAERAAIPASSDCTGLVDGYYVIDHNKKVITGVFSTPVLATGYARNTGMNYHNYAVRSASFLNMSKREYRGYTYADSAVTNWVEVKVTPNVTTESTPVVNNDGWYIIDYSNKKIIGSFDRGVDSWLYATDELCLDKDAFDTFHGSYVSRYLDDTNYPDYTWVNVNISA